jgi:hypothetical protein
VLSTEERRRKKARGVFRKRLLQSAREEVDEDNVEKVFE